MTKGEQTNGLCISWKELVRSHTRLDINAAEAMRDYLDSHKEFMAAKATEMVR